MTNPPDDAVRVKAGNEDFDVVLRNGALQLLKMLRNRGQVHMLTIATHDYALEMNSVFKLDFPTHRIFSRTHVATRSNPDISAPRVYLFDNLSRRENRNKIEFLRKISSTVMYYQVPAFEGYPTQHFSDKELNNLISRLDADIDESNSSVKENTSAK
jgi:hypothetical protein